MLVVAPLMHGNAQWVMWNAFMMGGTAVLYTEHRYDPDRVWRLVGEESVVSMGAGRRRHGPTVGRALAAAAPGTYDTSTLAVIGSGGAMLSSTVKARAAGAAARCDDHGPVRLERERGPGSRRRRGHRAPVRDERRHLGARRRAASAAPRGREDRPSGPVRDGSRIGYYKDAAKTAATFPVDADGVRWSIPGDLASVEPDGTITVHGRGSASINSGGEKIFPEEVEAAVKSHPDVFDAIVVGLPDERFGERVAVVVHPARPGDALEPRGAPGPLPAAHRRLQDPPSDCCWSRRSPDGGRQARCQGGQSPVLSRPG